MLAVPVNLRTRRCAFLFEESADACIAGCHQLVAADPIAVQAQTLGDELDLLLVLDLKRQYALGRAAVFERGCDIRGATSVRIDVVGAAYGFRFVEKHLLTEEITLSIEKDFAVAHSRTASKFDVWLESRGGPIFTGYTRVRIGRSAMIRSRASIKTRKQYDCPRSHSRGAFWIPSPCPRSGLGRGFTPAPSTLRSSEALQELDQDFIDLLRALLLDPVAGAGDDHSLFQIRSERTLHIVCAGNHFADYVTLAGSEDCELAQLCAVEKLGHLPVAIEVAIPVDPATKYRALEFAREKIEVRVGEPRRQLCRHRDALYELHRFRQQKLPHLLRHPP